MKVAWRRWITPLIVVSYVVVSNLALASQSALCASAGVALFFLMLIQFSIRPAWRSARIVLAVLGVVVVFGVARAELPPVPLMLPPVLVPAAFAWLFGHTLLGDRVALVERFARAVHAPEPLDGAHAAYARAVTVMWTWALAIMALINFFLVTSLSPGGLLDQFGQEPRWPIDVHAYLWLSNAVYIVTPVIFVAEFLFRLRRFPDYRLNNPLEFARRARARLPAVIEQVRRG
jgi:hypothetical protein